MNEQKTEHLVEQHVTYTLFKDGLVYVVENVPARVNLETGEQFFAPATVELLHELILGKQEPVRLLETPVYDFA